MISHLDPERLRSIAGGADPTDEEATHLLDCAKCGQTIDQASELDVALERLGAYSEPIREQLVLDRVLVADRSARRRANVVRFVAAAGALAAACALFVAWRATRPLSATVDAGPGAKIVRAIIAGDEVVELEGSASFQVPKLPVGRRFKVRAVKDELEVKGTAFRVDTEPSGFRSVAVDSGVVEVRPQCCAAVTLRAGDVWVRPTSPAVVPVAAPLPPAVVDAPSANPVAPSGAPATTAPTGSVAPSGSELLTQGTAAYDGGRYAAAAPLLSRAVAADPTASWARDARVLAGAAQVLAAAPAAIPGLGVSVASFDAAAQKASASGDAGRAKAAAVGAARRSAGDGARRRWCALASDGALPPLFRDEATRGCPSK